MKIGLLTYFAADNSGATLQAYATIKALESLGHDVTLINYDIPHPEQTLLGNVVLYGKHLKFQRFRRKYFTQKTQKYLSLQDLQNNPPKFDCYMVGSDQTWNPGISLDRTKGFFLDFGPEDAFRASYAASFGMQSWEENPWISREEARRLVNRIQWLSVREEDGVKILENELGACNVTQVVDPVLLFESYPELTGVFEQKQELIVYKLTNSSEFYAKAKEIGHDLNLPVRSIGSIRRIKGIKCGYPEGVEAWIRRIAGAKYVMTDSFHGTVFSILYQRQFVMYARSEKLSSRMVSLLKQLGIADRIVTEDMTACDIETKLKEPIDYPQVLGKLEMLRKSSFQFLKGLDSFKK